jgi:membrane protein DedA with SNARE-associated domain
MGHAITAFVEGVMGSPWVYVALLALAAGDGMLPILPSETLVVTAGVYSATGETTLALVIAAAAAGAFAGDHASYAIGRTAGARLLRRTGPDSSRGKALGWARAQLETRGGSILIVCRYIPGARTATTLTAGAVGHPLRSFSTFDGIAALSWGAYCALVGYIGGSAFEGNPLLGVGLGLGLALSVAGAVEWVRHARRTRAVAT